MFEWLGEHDDEAFFLFLHTNTIGGPHWGERYTEGLKPGSDEYRIAQYDAGIYRADNLVGKLFGQLRKAHILYESMIIVTSAQGEELGEGQPRIDQEPILVPLLIKLPGQQLRDHPLIVSGHAGLIDILPTILDYVDISAPRRVHGTTLLPRLTQDGPAGE